MKTIILMALIIPTIALTQDYFQKCNPDTGVCEKILYLPDNLYRQTELSQLSEGQCYIKKQSNGITAFYRIEKITGDTIFALSEIVQESNRHLSINKIFSQMYEWNGKHFNKELKSFPCSQTPNLSNNDYLQKCGYYKEMRGEFFCEPERHPALFKDQEIDFSEEQFKDTLFN